MIKILKLEIEGSFLNIKSIYEKPKLTTYSGEGNGNPLQYSCLENPMDGGAWWAAVHGVARSWTRLSDFTFTFHFHALEKERATHSSVLAWRIPGTGEPGGLPYMGSHRVGHDWSDLAAAATTYSVVKNLIFFLKIRNKIRMPTFITSVHHGTRVLAGAISQEKKMHTYWKGRSETFSVCRWCDFFFFSFLAAPHGLWDLSSTTRDWTWAFGSESMES